MNLAQYCSAILTVTLVSVCPSSAFELKPDLKESNSIGRQKIGKDEQVLYKKTLKQWKTSESITTAGFLGDIVDTVRGGQNILDREQRRQERKERIRQQNLDREARRREREERLAAAKKRREEYEAAKKAATEKQRLEAKRRQEYYESLSPEEKKAYVQRQQEIQLRQQEAAARLFLLFLSAGSSESSGSSASSDTTVYRRTNTYRPAPTPVRQPTRAISPFYK